MEKQDLRYSCFGVRSSCAQVFNTVAGAVTCICLCNLLQTLVTNGLPGIVLTTLERRFGFSSNESSWIASSYEVATIPVLILMALFGSR